jgi:hypothetical protein
LGLILLAVGMPPLTVACVGSPPGAASIVPVNMVGGQAVLASVPLANARVVFRDGLYNAVIPTSEVRTDGEGRFLIPRAILDKRIATYITVSDGKMAVAGIMTYDGAICRSTGKAPASAVVLDTDTSMTAAVLLTNLERLGFTNGEYHAKQGTELPQDLQRQIMDGLAAEAGKRVASALKPGDLQQVSFMSHAINRFAAPGRLTVQQDTRSGREQPVNLSTDLPVQQLMQQTGIDGLNRQEWESTALATLVDQGIISPDASGRLNPDSPITQDESAAIFAKVLGVAAKTDSVTEAAAKAEQAGLIKTRTAAAKTMTNLETAMLLARSLGIESAPGPFSEYRLPFADWYSVPEEQWGMLVALHAKGLLPLNANKEFGPRTVATKASVAELVTKAFASELAGPSYSGKKADETQRQQPVLVPQSVPDFVPPGQPQSMGSQAPPPQEPSKAPPAPPSPAPSAPSSAAASSPPVSSGGGGGSSTPAPTPTPASAKVEVTLTQGATSPTNEATIN